MTVTLFAPCRSRPRTRAEPMNPAPPVTTYLLMMEVPQFALPDSAANRWQSFRRPA